MKVTEHIKNAKRTLFSFEILPPLKGTSIESIYNSLDPLMEFNPPFIDSQFIEKYNNYIALEKNYLNYEPIYQLYYALYNVALWDNSYIKEVERILTKLKI